MTAGVAAVSASLQRVTGSAAPVAATPITVWKFFTAAVVPAP